MEEEEDGDVDEAGAGIRKVTRPLQVRTGGETGLMNNRKEIRKDCMEGSVLEWDISRKISVTLKQLASCSAIHLFPQ